MNQDIISYYKDRANEYEKIYAKPERQHDLKDAAIVLQSLLAEMEVLEIACGTGYWTEKIAEAAGAIHATDINESVLNIARNKHYKSKVTFELADFYNFKPEKKYESLFGGFIWSHILLQDLGLFIAKIKELVVPGGTIVFMDNYYVDGSNLPITATDEQGNTYQTRQLENGTAHRVLKNFPAKEFVLSKLSDIAAAIDFISLEYYWIVSLELKANNK